MADGIIQTKWGKKADDVFTLPNVEIRRHILRPIHKEENDFILSLT